MIYEFAFDTTPHWTTHVDLLHAKPPSYALLATCRYIYFDARRTYGKSYRAYWRKVYFTLDVDYSKPQTFQAAQAAVLRSPREVNSIRQLTLIFISGPLKEFNTFFDPQGLFSVSGALYLQPVLYNSYNVLAQKWLPRLTRSMVHERCGRNRFTRKVFARSRNALGHLAQLRHRAAFDDQILWLLHGDFPKSRVFEAA